jgi:hypothetical protein
MSQLPLPPFQIVQMVSMVEKLDTACQTVSSYAQKTCTMKTENAKFNALKDSETNMEYVLELFPFQLPPLQSQLPLMG